MAVYTQLSQEEIAPIVADYGLHTLRAAQGIAEGVENSNYLIETDEENSVRRSILTIFEKRVREEDLPFFIGLMEHLAQHDIPCPLPLKRTNGEIFYPLGDKQAVMVTFLEGQSRSVFSEQHLTQLGCVMAQMHKASRDFRLRRANDLSLTGWRELYEKTSSELETIEAGLTQLVADELHYLETHWPHDLPEGIIHADLFPNNVFFDGDQLSGVIDFYFACEDKLAYELAICLNCWCFESDGTFNADKSAAMIRAYDNERTLEADERHKLPILARGAALRFLLTRAHDWMFHADGALVTPLDPTEYSHKLRFHQQVTSEKEYGV